MNATSFDTVPVLGEVSGSRQLLLSIAAATFLLVLFSRYFRLGKSNDRPPMLSELIPHVGNTWLYMSAIDKFMDKAADALKKNGGIVGFYLGPKLTYFIRGSDNVQAMFRNTPSINSEALMLLGYESLMGLTPEDIAKFRNDKSGRSLTAPAPVFEHVPEKERYWAGIYDVSHKYLGQTNYIELMAKTYQKFLPGWLVEGYEEQLREQNVEGDGWVEMRLVPFMKAGMARAAMRALVGTRILEIVPDVVEGFWDFEGYMRIALFSPKPKWLFRHVYDALDRYLADNQKFVEVASKEFDWDSEENREAKWNPTFGAPFLRELIRWMRERNFSTKSQGGFKTLTSESLNSNAIPVTTWGLMELAKDPELRQAIRDEVQSAYTANSDTGARIFDPIKLTGLPLFQSFYTEMMRMHVSMNVTREVVAPGVKIGGYEIEVGSLLQAPTELGHYDEAVWGSKEHPASEFWAERHLKYVDSDAVDPKTGERKKTARFEVRGRPSDYFPYGGGVGMCPGRVFAKQEIMITWATWVSRFEFEFIEWLQLDGRKSDRPAENHIKYRGSAAVPPDRDMRIRWKRIW
ncbi:cytochrome p450 family protein [Naviculisporaceae sp. PSN 640]